MFDDDELPQNEKKQPKDLSGLSVEELKDYITDLEKEIERTQAELGKKENYSSEADSFFKS